MLKRAVLKLLELRRDRIERREQARLERRLAGSAGYDFTSDWVSPHYESWGRLFAGLVDRPLRMLEIGSYEGRSTVWFLEHVLRHPGSTMTCVDLFSTPSCDVRFDHNVRLSQSGAKVRKLKGRSGDSLLGLAGESFDVIYIDGSHDAADVLLDAVLSWPLLKAGGILLFDDYGWEPQLLPSERPQLAIDLFLESRKGQFELLRQNYQVAVRKLA